MAVLRYLLAILILPALALTTAAAPPTQPAPDPYAPGAEIEALWGRSWYDATVVKTEGGKTTITYSDNTTGDVTKAEMRLRGVPASQIAPDKQVQYLGAGAKVETASGPWWSDGVIVKREAKRAQVRDEHGIVKWVDFDKIRTREVAPGGKGTIAAAANNTPPAAPAGTAAPTATAPTTPTAPNPLAPDAPAARTIAFAKPPGDWIAAADPATKPVRPAPANPAPIFLPPMAATLGAGRANAVWQRITDVLLPTGSALGLVIHTQQGPNVPYIAQVERVDFLSGTVSQAIAMPDGFAPIDVSPDGRRVLLRKAGNQEAVLTQLISIETKPGLPLPAKIKDLQPFPGGDSRAAAISAAALIDADHALFASGGNDVIMVDVPQQRVVWSTKAGGRIERFAISPGRAQVAIPTDLGVFLLDTQTGNILGLLEGRAPGSSVMSFSPDGKRLAATAHGRISVWDIDTSKQWRNFEVRAAGGAAGGDVDWINNDYLMFANTRLIDLERRLVVWSYQYPDTRGQPVTASAAGRFWYLASEKAKVPRRQLVAITLPQEEVKLMTATMKPQNIYALYPGMKVSLSVNLSGDPDQLDKVTTGLTTALQRAGMVVADGAPVRLEASSSPGESKQMRLRPFGGIGPPREEAVTVTPTKLRLAFLTADGKTIWEAKSITGDVFGMITAKQGQTLEQAVADAQKPKFDFFHNPTLPDYLPLPREKEGFGESALTLKGLQPPVVKTN